MSYNLIVKAPDGTLLSAGDRAALLGALQHSTMIERLCEITEFELEGEPGDWETLVQCFERGELPRGEFDAFCASHHLGESDLSARLFMDLHWGQNLFAVGRPSNRQEAQQAYHSLVAFAREHQLVIRDPQVGRDLSLLSPEAMPPGW